MGSETCNHDWTPMVGGEVCYGCNHIRRYDSVTYTAPVPCATPTPTADEGDGAYEAFRSRVNWFYRNAPECQEARKHSFGRQADVAFTLALNEAIALRARPLPADVQAVVERVREIVEPTTFRARLENGATFVSPEEIADLRTLLAHLQRDTSPAPVVTEAMVEAYKAERLAIAKERYAAPGGIILTDSQADGQVRRLLTAALAATRGEA